MPFIDIEQLSTDWLQMRCACVTASHVCDVMAKFKDPKKKGEHSDRMKYRKAKMREQLTGRSAETYVSPYMEAGLDIEPLARAAYEVARDVEVLNGGLFVHDQISRFMASPDGRVGDDGLIEVKFLTGCTTDANHLDLIEGAEVPEEYLLQMQAQLSCSGRQFVDFISYDPYMPPKLRLFVKRFPRDEKKIAEIEAEVQTFLEQVAQKLLQLGDGSLTPVLEASLQEVR